MNVPQRAAVIVNPSKVIDLDERRKEICELLAEADWPEPLWLTTTPEDPGCGMAVQAVDAGVDVVLTCGGDGTVMAVASVLAGTDVALALVPSGTGNLLATNLGVTRDVRAAVEVAIHGDRRRIDVGIVDGADTSTGHPGTFTVMAGMGFDAEMLEATPDTAKRRFGWLAYVAAGARKLRSNRVPMRIRLDGGRWIRRRARSVLVANVGRLQGGIPLLPDAAPDDGWLDVAVLTPHDITDWVRLGWGVIMRRGGSPQLETFRAKKVEVHTDREQPRELDGDVVAPARLLVARISPAALLLCVPPATPRPPAV
ncbi:NAD(+)/NADH kinase [Dactylosporangium aurantiacum]|uniref:NAD(+)/NADH kinase n=1 Tax=Dactylosporangium aurantiacum TaxID=35754 RepID=A0A9Q9IJH7_9ACTN|nr:diacylglycerol kinase family protein [Dactylosporangium aurantiacum]MDG6105997.1 diacylglycerol kinase family protein [Dactylosporangium aurantiacum]UWZ55953.1 NAD(+)/NADH kinase [Dactylosporangium aurantiacum]